MPEIFFTLEEILKELDTTSNRIAVEAKIRPATVYNIENDSATRIHKDTLAAVLSAINKIAKEKGIEKRYSVKDIMYFEDDI